MFNCKRRCRNCFPNGCCGFCKPPPQVQQQVDTVIHLKKAVVEHLSPPEEKRGCCDRFRCWCCRKQRLTGLIKRTYTEAEQQAQRVVTMTIEYSKYSNLDTATNARLLSTEHQLAYYKEKFHPDTKLEFYLVNNTEYDFKNFEVRRNEAESLCRTVLQLKGMKNHYPSDNDLDKILDQSHTRTIGNVYEEPILRLAFDSVTARMGGSQSQGLPHRASMEQNPTTVSE